MSDDLEEMEPEREIGYEPPTTKHSGYHFGPVNHKSNGCVHHSVYYKEILDRRAETGEDWNGALAGALMNALLEKTERNYAGWEYELYCIKPYCWCENDDCKWCNGELPYFMDKRSGLTMRWYKHPHRGFEASRKYMADEIRQMARDFGVDLEDA